MPIENALIKMECRLDEKFLTRDHFNAISMQGKELILEESGISVCFVSELISPGLAAK